MRRINWVTAIFLFVTPPLAAVWGGLHTYLTGVHALEIIFFLLYFVAAGMSVTAGYHRLFAHRAYETNRLVKLFFLLFGAASFQHSVLTWSSDHRRHHKHIDRDGDPYNIRRGFLFAHIGWLLVTDHKPERFGNVPDLQADPLIRFQHRFYMPIAVAMGFGMPFVVGLAFGNPWGFVLWAGVIRVVVGHHTTFLVNSLAHTLGRRPYTLDVSARDSVVTAVLTFGEGYHNFHHRFAADYRNGIRRYHWDPTKWLIQGLAAIGWAWDLRSVPRERIVAAQLQTDTQRLLDRLRDRSEDIRLAVRAQLTEIARNVEHAATRLSNLERQLRSTPRDRLAELRAQMRTARADFRAARERWQNALAEAAGFGAEPAVA